MATSEDFSRLTANLGLEDDCPLCGYSWPGCHGLCVAHETSYGRPGPYHDDYNDDCGDCALARLALLRAVYEGVSADAESLAPADVGADLAYLLGVICCGLYVAWRPDRPIVAALRRRFPSDHAVWDYVRLDTEADGVAD